MKNIILTFDILQDQQAYLKEGLKIAKLFTPEEVILLDIIDTVELELIEAEQRDIVVAEQKEREAKMQQLLVKINEQLPFSLAAKVTVGNPKKEIVKIANEEKSGLVICGNHHYSKLEYILKYGSVSTYLTQHLSCNLLILNTTDNFNN